MYQQHFGITGSPFQLSPDPFFYFDGDPHRAALAALRQAFTGSLPFVVLSGEVGAGKTTVLHAWLAEVAAGGTAVARLTNTQLDADDLMHAVAIAFGMSTAMPGDAHASLRTFLRGLNGHAALLAIDEAQNLDPDALRGLAVLADMAAEENAVLRICLAGQPELRTRLADPTLHAVSARVQRACHLDPLDPPQTHRYILHRLLKVGWSGMPAFDPAAFDEIHRLTGGVPRRINVLANRVFLSLFMSGSERIDTRTVAATAHALHAEMGEWELADAATGMVFEPAEGAAIPLGALLLVVGGRSDQIKAVPLLRAIDGRRDLPPAVIVGVSDEVPWRLNHELHDFLGLTKQRVTLPDASQATLEHVAMRFEQLIGKCRPEAVIVFDRGPVAHCCAGVAHEHGVPLVHVGADNQLAGESDDPGSARAAIASLADLRFECQSGAADDAPGRDPAAFAVGNLLIDAANLALQLALEGSRWAADRPLAHDYTEDKRGYGIVALKQPAMHESWSCPEDIVAVLREVCRDLPLVWPMRRDTMLAMRSSGLARTLAGDRIACIEELGHVSLICLLRHATCVLTDCPDVMEEAAALGVPCLSLGARHASHVDAGGWLPGVEVRGSVTHATRAVWDVMFNGASIVDLPGLWDGNAALRMASRLAHWRAQAHRQARSRARHAL
jgi:general secretion pathway protein A